MIADAVDAALLLWRALWLWLWMLAGAVVVTVGGLGAMAGVWWAVNAIRRTVGRLLGPPEALCARESDEHPEKAVRLLRPREQRPTPRSAVPSDGEKSSEAA